MLIARKFKTLNPKLVKPKVFRIISRVLTCRPIMRPPAVCAK